MKKYLLMLWLCCSHVHAVKFNDLDSFVNTLINMQEGDVFEFLLSNNEEYSLLSSVEKDKWKSDLNIREIDRVFEDVHTKLRLTIRGLEISKVLEENLNLVRRKIHDAQDIVIENKNNQAARLQQPLNRLNRVVLEKEKKFNQRIRDFEERERSREKLIHLEEIKRKSAVVERVLDLPQLYPRSSATNESRLQENRTKLETAYANLLKIQSGDIQNRDFPASSHDCNEFHIKETRKRMETLEEALRDAKKKIGDEEKKVKPISSINALKLPSTGCFKDDTLSIEGFINALLNTEEKGTTEGILKKLAHDHANLLTKEVYSILFENDKTSKKYFLQQYTCRPRLAPDLDSKVEALFK